MTSTRTSAPRRSGPTIVAASSALVLGAVLVTRLSCSPRQDAIARSAGDVTPASAQLQQPRIEPGSSSAEPSRTLGTPALEKAQVSDDPAMPTSSAAASVTLPAAAPPALASNTPARATPHALPRVDARELSLLAGIERELSRDPPAEVHGLLAEYRAGRDHATLVEYVQRNFPEDFALRVLALRWIDDVRPSDRGQRRPGLRAPDRGTGRSWVAPIRPKQEQKQQP